MCSTIIAELVVALHTAAELSVEEGETVTVESVESHWGWATKKSGQSGWVPLQFIEAVS